MQERDLLGYHVEVAKTLWQRTKGLLGRSGLPAGHGLLILRCNAIHTCFMKFTIDATFLDKNERIVKVVRNIPPGRWCIWGGFRATMVLETQSQD